MQRAFACSGKFRLNANGRRLDAWLVYKCVICDDTWNHTLFERRNTRDLHPELLSALEANDPALVGRFAFDVASLRRVAHRIEEFAGSVAHKEMLLDRPDTPERLEIGLSMAIPIAIRLDRLLAAELGLSRARIGAMMEAGHIITTAALNRPARDGCRVEIDLSVEEADVILREAGG
nr:DUF1062 domain-containing protein [Mesorhizobium loti]